jgi:hypothetical protein
MNLRGVFRTDAQGRFHFARSNQRLSHSNRRTCGSASERTRATSDRPHTSTSSSAQTGTNRSPRTSSSRATRTRFRRRVWSGQLGRSIRPARRSCGCRWLGSANPYYGPLRFVLVRA